MRKVIHSIEIEPNTEISELKKTFRKKLMVGGAVLALKKPLSDSEHSNMFAKFIVGLTPYNLQAVALTELAKEENLKLQLQAKLASLRIKSISRALLLRPDLHSQLRKEISLGRDKGAKKDAAVLIESQQIAEMDQEQLRSYYTKNLGTGEKEVISRLALCKLKSLPDDLKHLLGRDVDQQVRFQARYL